ncbi:Predicted DNA-binding protein, contains XRE-type HTH domain [Onishia taeanensis]|uniref:Predicted DNA-binding protein, contains XRE-type HTH domain n=1 Tax=Onishia taeanensis TaxID=284577 RepID=A0A1G7V336_9GAMM|nr:XRE family transcriptional regulator [Halomonas taeanensis]MAX33284.1 XRE family transcriptional regulator [Halomonadaceae bacterium]SDG53978.1 Predicted DNA-binding protein, contains XRE-type HTH domain [Halomonas taeanensis]
MANERFSSVWDAIEDTPEQAENMRLRAELMGKIADRVAEWGETQKVAAERLGITQPRLNDLVNGRINRFSLDALVNLSRPALGGHLHFAFEDDTKEKAMA